MLNIGTAVYSPVLRLKQGEYMALGQLPLDVVARLFPLFVIPPPKERDPELHRPLTASELVLIPAQRLRLAWPFGRACSIRATFQKARDSQCARLASSAFSSRNCGTRAACAGRRSKYT